MEGSQVDSPSVADGSHSLVVPLGPKAAYWIVAGYFGLAAGLGAFVAGIMVYSIAFSSQGIQTLIVRVIVAVVCISPALLLAPRFLSERRGGTLEVGREDVRKSIGRRRAQLISWTDMTEVTYGLRRVQVGKTSGVGQAVRIRGSKELLPLDVDEITYQIDHDKFLEAVRLIVEAAQEHAVAVKSADTADW